MMNRNQTDLAYRRTAIEGASPIGLVIALYDTLAGNLGRAAAAVRNQDIELRCKELNHAALVLARLESWIDLANGGELAQNLTDLYAYIRAKMLEGSIKKSAEMFEAQMDLILQVRSSWQIRDTSTPKEFEPPWDSSLSESSSGAERTSFSMSA